MNPQHPQLVPLLLLAEEIGGDANALAVKLGDDAVVFDGIGLRCVAADLARRIIDDHRARQAADREARAAQEAERRARPHPVRERVRAIGRAQERFEGSDLPALARLKAGEIEGRLETSGRHLDELLTGEPHYHRLTGREAQ